MRIAICDDDLREQKQFEEALRGWDPTRSAEKFLSGAALMEAAKTQPRFDIAFLDIYMPNENGIEVAEALRKISPETGIVFVTTSKEHAVEAFSLYATHYLVKPVTAKGVGEALKRLREMRFRHRNSITLTVGRERYTVFLDQICLLESDNHTVNVSLIDGRKLKVRMPFSEMEQMMDDKFLRINRGIVVNMDFIEQMGANTCVLRSGVRLPITIRQSASIRAAYDNYVFDRLSERKGF